MKAKTEEVRDKAAKGTMGAAAPASGSGRSRRRAKEGSSGVGAALRRASRVFHASPAGLTQPGEETKELAVRTRPRLVP